MQIDPVGKLLKENKLEISIAEAIFDGTGDGILIIDKDYRLLYENRATKEIFGANVGDFCYKAFLKRSEPCEVCPTSLAFQDGQIHKVEKEIPILKEMMHVEVVSSPIKNTSGEIVAVAEIARIITERKKLEEEREKLIRELKDALSEVKTLRGIIPICSFCKKIRNDEGYYEQVEAYISRHSEAAFSHTFCPDCGAEHYPEFF